MNVLHKLNTSDLESHMIEVVKREPGILEESLLINCHAAAYDALSRFRLGFRDPDLQKTVVSFFVRPDELVIRVFNSLVRSGVIEQHGDKYCVKGGKTWMD